MSNPNHAEYFQWITGERIKLAELDEQLNPPGEDDEEFLKLPAGVREARLAKTRQLQLAMLELARAERRWVRVRPGDIRAYNSWDCDTEMTPAVRRVAEMTQPLMYAAHIRVELAAELAELTPNTIQDSARRMAVAVRDEMRSTLWERLGEVLRSKGAR